VGEWHVVGGFVSCIPNHESLVASSDLLVLLVRVHTHCNLRRLLVDGNDDSCSFIIHSDLVGVIPHVLDGLAGDLLEVDLPCGADLAEDHAD